MTRTYHAAHEYERWWSIMASHELKQMNNNVNVQDTILKNQEPQPAVPAQHTEKDHFIACFIHDTIIIHLSLKITTRTPRIGKNLAVLLSLCVFLFDFQK